MKFGNCLGLLLLALLVSPSPPAEGRAIERTSILGWEYVSLEDWAKANGGTARWTVPRKEVKVTLPSGSMTFLVDSRRSLIKGVHVSLSLPVAAKNGVAFVGAIDMNTTLQPLLFPARYPSGRRVRSIVLDPGHGGKDPGNQEGRRQEKVYTLTFAREVRDLLVQAGFKVSLTRNSDVFLDLPDRPETARRRDADLFVSLHFNSFDGSAAASVKGAEVYCLTPARASSSNAGKDSGGAGSSAGNAFDSKNVLLAWQVQRALCEKTGAEDRGVKRARYMVLRPATMPAILVEAAFMTNPADSKKIYEATQRRQMAQAIVDGILAYQLLVER